ncbi:hypothetical protein PMAYCL1PPCAC_31787 [Pristionchus mayeri]|uniref:Uncharacterized protein n=1 Tax=Pristionchus mayeri TaxID=1317129 RepID=A0AAN5DFI0_9BILA|nr:hypothetical protein PMAYCL1PPCAC_31787 [Pristionchus mayeri]
MPRTRTGSSTTESKHFVHPSTIRPSTSSARMANGRGPVSPRKLSGASEATLSPRKRRASEMVRAQSEMPADKKPRHNPSTSRLRSVTPSRSIGGRELTGLLLDKPVEILEVKRSRNMSDAAVMALVAKMDEDAKKEANRQKKEFDEVLRAARADSEMPEPTNTSRVDRARSERPQDLTRLPTRSATPARASTPARSRAKTPSRASRAPSESRSPVRARSILRDDTARSRRGKSVTFESPGAKEEEGRSSSSEPEAPPSPKILRSSAKKGLGKDDVALATNRETRSSSKPPEPPVLRARPAKGPVPTATPATTKTSSAKGPIPALTPIPAKTPRTPPKGPSSSRAPAKASRVSPPPTSSRGKTTPVAVDTEVDAARPTRPNHIVRRVRTIVDEGQMTVMNRKRREDMRESAAIVDECPLCRVPLITNPIDRRIDIDAHEDRGVKVLETSIKTCVAANGSITEEAMLVGGRESRRRTDIWHYARCSVIEKFRLDGSNMPSHFFVPGTNMIALRNQYLTPDVLMSEQERKRATEDLPPRLRNQVCSLPVWAKDVYFRRRKAYEVAVQKMLTSDEAGPSTSSQIFTRPSRVRCHCDKYKLQRCGDKNSPCCNPEMLQLEALSTCESSESEHDESDEE